MIGVDIARKIAPKQPGASRRFLAKHVRRLGQFCVVGASGVLVNTALLYVLTEAGGLTPLMSATFATEAAILSNFALNDRWTFRDLRGNRSWLRRAVQYNFVALGGLLISIAVLAALTYLLGIYYLFANFVAIGAATLWNYAVNHHWTWPATRLLVEEVALTRVQEPADRGRYANRVRDAAFHREGQGNSRNARRLGQLFLDAGTASSWRRLLSSRQYELDSQSIRGRSTSHNGDRRNGWNARQLGQLLLDAGAISEEDLLRALEEQEKSGGMLGEILLAYGMLDAMNLTPALAANLGVPTLAAGDRPVPLLPAERARNLRAVALTEFETGKGRPLPVAFADPKAEHVEAVRKLLQRPIRPKLVGEDSIRMLLTELYGEEDAKEAVAALAEEHPELSAKQNYTSPPQAVVLGVVFSLLIIGGIVAPLLTVIALVGVGTLFYVLYTLFRTYATWQGWKAEDAFRPSQQDLDDLEERELPVYTILLPVYGEKPRTLRVLIESLSDLEYPKHKLDVLLLVENDDEGTQEAIREVGRPGWLKVLYVPAVGPRTKPKAMIYGLLYAKGELLTIYDAEDKPEPYQLKEAVWLYRKLDDPDVACLQAKLNYYNPRQNLLTRWFTLEYSAWFDLFLPGLHQMGAPIPLGGTSNHFKIDALRGVMNWDPYNVTEDADLGLRLFRAGKKVAMLHSTTYEEANSQLGNWIRQRSRWIKGYIQTLFVHTRHPWTLYKEIGLKNALIFVATVGGLVFTVLVSPIFWVLTLLWVVAQPGFVMLLFPGPVYYAALACLFVGNFFFVFLGLMGAVEKGMDDLAPHTLLTPVYWFLMSVAGYMALYEFIFDPHHWHKTEHGLHFEEEVHEILPSGKIEEEMHEISTSGKRD